MKSYSKAEKCKPKPHALARPDPAGQPLVNNGENGDKERSWHCLGKSAPPHMVHAAARGPNNPTMYLDKAKPSPHKNYTIFMSAFFIKGQRGETMQISGNAAGPPNTCGYPNNGLLTGHERK